MALKALMLRKKLTDAKKALDEARAKTATFETKKTPQTDKLTISVAGDDFTVGGKKKRLVRAKSTEETTTSLETWFENVVSPVEAA